MMGLACAAFIIGGLNDNANDDQKEIGDTVREIQRRVALSGDEAIRNSI